MTFDQVMDATGRMNGMPPLPLLFWFWKLVNSQKPLLGEWILLYRCEQLRGNGHEPYWSTELDPQLVAEISRKWAEPDPMALPKVLELSWRWRKDPDRWKVHYPELAK